MSCNNPAHSEPFACYRQAEGGFVCESTLQLEGLLYAITVEPRLFRWHEGKIQWSPNCQPPVWSTLGVVEPELNEEHIYAPWTHEQVDALNGYQRAGVFHPYTCRDRDGHPHEVKYGDHGCLRATSEGWVCAHCDYTQTWAWAWTADEERWQALRLGVDEQRWQTLRLVPPDGFEPPTSPV